MKLDENIIDLVLGALSVLAAAAFVGAGSFEFWGMAMSDHLITLVDGYSMSYHHGITILTFVGATLVNTPSWGRLNSAKRILVLGSLGLVGVSIVSPDATASVFANPTTQTLGIGFMTGGYWGIAHS